MLRKAEKIDWMVYGDSKPKYQVILLQIANQQDDNVKGIILREYPPFELSLPSMITCNVYSKCEKVETYLPL